MEGSSMYFWAKNKIIRYVHNTYTKYIYKIYTPNQNRSKTNNSLSIQQRRNIEMKSYYPSHVSMKGNERAGQAAKSAYEKDEIEKIPMRGDDF